jgi:hypothetical protein
MTPWIDGLLEGHEEFGARVIYRVIMFSYILFSIFAGVCNIGLAAHDGSEAAYPMLSVVILLLLAFSLFLVKSYKVDAMDPKFKRAAVVLIGIVFALDVTSAMIFSKTLHYKEPVAPEVRPTTVAPTLLPTPTPNATRNGTQFFSWRDEQLREQAAAVLYLRQHGRFAEADRISRQTVAADEGSIAIEKHHHTLTSAAGKHKSDHSPPPVQPPKPVHHRGG